MRRSFLRSRLKLTVAFVAASVSLCLVASIYARSYFTYDFVRRNDLANRFVGLESTNGSLYLTWGIESRALARGTFSYYKWPPGDWEDDHGFPAQHWMPLKILTVGGPDQEHAVAVRYWAFLLIALPLWFLILRRLRRATARVGFMVGEAGAHQGVRAE